MSAQFMQEQFSGYGYVVIADGETPSFAETSFSETWHERYFREGFYKIDPVFEFNSACGNRSAAKLLSSQEMSSPLFEEARAVGADSNFVSVSYFAGSRMVFGGVNHDLDERQTIPLHLACQRKHRMHLSAKIDTLTDSQIDFLELCEEGCLDKQIAIELGISISAIAQRKKVICQRVGVSSFRSALNLYSLRKWSGIAPL